MHISVIHHLLQWFWPKFSNIFPSFKISLPFFLKNCTHTLTLQNSPRKILKGSQIITCLVPELYQTVTKQLKTCAVGLPAVALPVEVIFFVTTVITCILFLVWYYIYLTSTKEQCKGTKCTQTFILNIIKTKRELLDPETRDFKT